MAAYDQTNRHHFSKTWGGGGMSTSMGSPEKFNRRGTFSISSRATLSPSGDKEGTQNADNSGETGAKDKVGSATASSKETEKGSRGTAVQTDVVTWSIVRQYLQACGFWVFLLALLVFVPLFTMSRLFATVWLQYWLDKGDGRYFERQANLSVVAQNLTEDEMKGFVTDNPDLWFYQTVLAMSLPAMLLVGMLKGFSLTVQSIRGSFRLHNDMLSKVVRAPIGFFDKTPVGDIINRFSKDMDELDVRIPFFFEFVSQAFVGIVAQFIMVMAYFPLAAAPLAVVVLAFYLLHRFLFRGIVEARRMDNVTKSPVVNDISVVVPGIPVIRGFQREYLFQKRFNTNVNHNLSAHALFRYSNRWFTLRCEVLGVICVLVTAAACVVFKDKTSPAVAGIVLANMFQASGFLPYLTRLASEFKARFTSVARICQYGRLDQEASMESPAGAKPPEEWPSKGRLIFEKVDFGYDDGAENLVLRKLDLTIDPGVKVGIVGRTGAGKTSMIAALLRLHELKSGRIRIDDVDVAKIGLRDLRSAVAVIPQDPVLFQGTIRHNLDPFNQYDDEALWKALEKAHLKQKFSPLTPGSGAHQNDGSSKAKGLSTAVDSDGDNFSVGEKQLICLSRALLRGNKILLLDEPTASVDIKTDTLIQSTIKEEFKDCTVMIIAHRLHTVVNYDKILVMDKGQIVEFGTPNELLSKNNGLFKSMMDATQSMSLSTTSYSSNK